MPVAGCFCIDHDIVIRLCVDEDINVGKLAPDGGRSRFISVVRRIVGRPRFAMATRRSSAAVRQLTVKDGLWPATRPWHMSAFNPASDATPATLRPVAQTDDHRSRISLSPLGSNGYTVTAQVPGRLRMDQQDQPGI